MAEVKYLPGTWENNVKHCGINGSKSADMSIVFPIVAKNMVKKNPPIVNISTWKANRNDAMHWLRLSVLDISIHIYTYLYIYTHK